MYQTDAVGNAEHMRVDCDPLPSEADRKHHVRRLASNARQADQCVIILRHFTAEVAAQLLRHGNDVL